MDLELATLWLAGSTVVLAVDTVAAARILVPRFPGNDITAVVEARDFRVPLGVTRMGVDPVLAANGIAKNIIVLGIDCLLYTSDAADE